jgi:hypothetical protein
MSTIVSLLSLFVFFLLAIVLSDLLRITASDYLFGIFKLFSQPGKCVDLYMYMCARNFNFASVSTTF